MEMGLYSQCSSSHSGKEKRKTEKNIQANVIFLFVATDQPAEFTEITKETKKDKKEEKKKKNQVEQATTTV